MDDSRRRELDRAARLTLDDVAFLVIEPLDVNYPWSKAGRIRIAAREGQPPQSSSTLPATELERRSREIAEGHVQTISWETARTEILTELKQRRAPRTAS